MWSEMKVLKIFKIVMGLNNRGLSSDQCSAAGSASNIQTSLGFFSASSENFLSRQPSKFAILTASADLARASVVSAALSAIVKGLNIKLDR